MEKSLKGIEISNPQRLIYKDVTKLDVAKYYSDVATSMLPYIKNRPLSVVRCHQGIEDCFFKKHPTQKHKYLKIVDIGDEEYFCLDKEEGIIYEVQMGTIEFHIFGSEKGKLEKPNLMFFDLDPDKNLSLEKLKEGVCYLKEVLDDLSLRSYLKTSGGKGYHILVPFSFSKNYESFFNFSKNIALLLEKKYPKIFTSNIRKSERNGKIFVDYLRNNFGATCVAPFSLRAREGAKISFPIDWKDLEKISPNEIDIFNYKKYFDKNFWKDFFIQKQKIY